MPFTVQKALHYLLTWYPAGVAGDRGGGQGLPSAGCIGAMYSSG